MGLNMRKVFAGSQKWIVIWLGAKGSEKKIKKYNLKKENCYMVDPRFEKTKRNNIKQFRLAICDKNGKEKIRLAGQNTSFYPGIAKKKEEQEVETMTLDNFIKKEDIKHIDYLYMNVEGAEYRIFKPKTLRFLNITDRIYVDFHYGCLGDGSTENKEIERIKNILKGRGFSIGDKKRGKTGKAGGYVTVTGVKKGIAPPIEPKKTGKAAIATKEEKIILSKEERVELQSMNDYVEKIFKPGVEYIESFRKDNGYFPENRMTKDWKITSEKIEKKLREFRWQLQTEGGRFLIQFGKDFPEEDIRNKEVFLICSYKEDKFNWFWSNISCSKPLAEKYFPVMVKK